MKFTIAALYHFAPLQDYKQRRSALLALMRECEIKGSILLAAEGINGTVSGSSDALHVFLSYMRAWPGFEGLSAKFSYHGEQPFSRSKVKLKKELISLGEPADPARQTGTYVTPKEWNALLCDPEIVLIDARNDYEYYLGHFKGARNPHTRKFKQLATYTRETLNPAQNKKVATYCTGGIRCEKYTAWLKEQGYDEVYHLQGGILQYLEEIPAEESLWEGDCYVFDERLAVGHGLIPSTEVTACPGCGHPLKPVDRLHPDYAENSTCHYCATAIPSNVDQRPRTDRYAL